MTVADLAEQLDDQTDAPRFLIEPAAACGPTAVAQTWAGTDTYRVGSWHIGIRSDSDETGAVVEKLLSAHRVPELMPPGANFSVRLADTRGGNRGLQMLLRGTSVIVRSRNPARVLDGLLYHLDAIGEPEPVGLRVAANSLVARDGRAILVPQHLTSWLKQLQPRLSRLGLQFVDTRYATIDIDRTELVVPAPEIDADLSVIAALDRPAGGSELERVRPGRYPLAAWTFLGGADKIGPTSRGLAVAANMSIVDVDRLGPQGALEALASLFARVVPYGLWYTTPETLVEQLRPLAKT